MCEKYLEFSVAESIDVDAPPDVAWSLVSNFEGHPHIMSCIDSFVRTDTGILPDDTGDDGREQHQHGPTKVGSRFRRTLVTNDGIRVVTDYICVEMDDGPNFPRSIALYSEKYTDHTAGRVTWTVVDLRRGGDGGEDDKNDDWKEYGVDESGASNVSNKSVGNDSSSGAGGCRIIMSVSLVPTRFFAVAGRLVCCCMYRSVVSRTLHQFLEDFGTARENRPESSRTS